MISAPAIIAFIHAIYLIYRYTNPSENKAIIIGIIDNIKSGIDINKRKRILLIFALEFNQKKIPECVKLISPILHTTLICNSSCTKYTFKNIMSFINALENFQTPKEIEIKNDTKGAPFINLIDFPINNIEIKISLSHCKDKAIAYAMIVENV